MQILWRDINLDSWFADILHHANINIPLLTSTMCWVTTHNYHFVSKRKIFSNQKVSGGDLKYLVFDDIPGSGPSTLGSKNGLEDMLKEELEDELEDKEDDPDSATLAAVSSRRRFSFSWYNPWARPMTAMPPKVRIAPRSGPAKIGPNPAMIWPKLYMMVSRGSSFWRPVKAMSS